MSEEAFPVHSSIEVLKGITIEKTVMWWSAILFQKSYSGKPQIAIYLWGKDKERWKRKGKFIVRNASQWEKIKEAVKKLLPKLEEKK